MNNRLTFCDSTKVGEDQIASYRFLQLALLEQITCSLPPALPRKKFSAKVASATICEIGDVIVSITINKDDFFNNEPIKIESPKYGLMEFSELILKDYSWLNEEQIRNLSAREFIVQLTHSHLLNPKLNIQEVHGWGDNDLSFVAI